MNGFQIGSKRLKVQHKRTAYDEYISNSIPNYSEIPLPNDFTYIPQNYNNDNNDNDYTNTTNSSGYSRNNNNNNSNIITNVRHQQQQQFR
jgi:hypothetical protein